jgi:hypothetical protein
MSTPGIRLAGPVGEAHPLVRSRRRREIFGLSLAVLVPLLLGMVISIQMSRPSLTVLFAVSVGVVGVCTLVSYQRYEVTVAIVALYLGLLEGPVKLGSGAHEVGSVVRDVLIGAVALGCVLRMIARKERFSLPPLSAWVIAFTMLVIAEAFNPATANILKALGGFRQELEWVPFFFFGYAIVRTRDRFRAMFIVLGVIALINGVVSTYQTRLSPGQLASWGPGYRELVQGTTESGKKGGISARTYSVEGVAHVRPPGLGPDVGFGGGVGVVALAGTLALLAFTQVRQRRWPLVLLCLGALLGVATGLGRLQVVGAVLDVIAFAALSVSAGRRVTKPLGALLVILVIAVPLGALLVSFEGSQTFARYTSLAPESVQSSHDTKTASLNHIPKQIQQAPFGVGLGTVGGATGFGGRQSNLIEGHGVSADTEYNFLLDELGLPGLLLWVGLTIRVLTLGISRLRRIRDVEIRIYLAALLSTLIAFTIMGFSGPTMSSAAFGPFVWFAIGVISYWFLGPGWRSQSGSAPAPAAST